MAKINIARCLEALKKIRVEGSPNTQERKDLVEEAIGLIQADPAGALKGQYIGFKNYAHFGDQRCDGPAGTGPRHGSIVFSIGRNRSGEEVETLDSDCIYFLECWREFGEVKLPDESPNSYRSEINANLATILYHYQEATEKAAMLGNLLDREVELASEYAPANK